MTNFHHFYIHSNVYGSKSHKWKISVSYVFSSRQCQLVFTFLSSYIVKIKDFAIYSENGTNYTFSSFLHIGNLKIYKCLIILSSIVNRHKTLKNFVHGRICNKFEDWSILLCNGPLKLDVRCSLVILLNFKHRVPQSQSKRVIYNSFKIVLQIHDVAFWRNLNDFCKIHKHFSPPLIAL